MKTHPTEAPIRNQKEIISARTRLNVTTHLYLRPNDNARSLSTLIAVDVKRETPQRTTEEACCMPTTYSWTLLLARSVTINSGCVISPTQRSVTARHRNKSFVGGQIEVTLLRAIRMRTLPSVAVMERKVFKDANAADIPTSDAGYLTSNEEFVCSSVVFSIFLKASNKDFFLRKANVGYCKLFLFDWFWWCTVITRVRVVLRRTVVGYSGSVMFRELHVTESEEFSSVDVYKTSFV